MTFPRWVFNCELLDMSQATSANPQTTFRSILEARISYLERGIRQRDGIAVEQSPDPVEEVQRASERALAICNLDRESHELRNARAALRRIREGTFGVCEQCEENIHPKRLAAIPWAVFCLQCQEDMDGRQTAPTSMGSVQGNAI